MSKLPTFARAFAQSRGILMVHTFNEGEELPKGKPGNGPLRRKTGSRLRRGALRGWHNGGATLQTFVQISGAPLPRLSAIFDDSRLLHCDSDGLT
ncbi:MAG: hypothetical protein HC868_11880 [Sphingomonadales bacterium]|nr:hypothetical protein [Sphingomonadales bacterium]